jgi:hypothetical protein
MPFSLLSFGLAVVLWLRILCPPLLADELTIDPPIIWEAECYPCRPAAVPPPLPLCELEENIIVDLIDPLYENGVLTTENGGVLSAPDLRIQAQKITYVRKVDEANPILTVACEGNILIDYKEWVLAGDSLYYDFVARTGFLINGRTAAPPWYIGGREILMMADGNLIVVDGFITTSEGEVDDVVLRSPHICLTSDRIIVAKHVNFRVNQVPIFWLPRLVLDLNNIERSPFAVKFGWGGFLGSYISVLYRFLSWGAFKATARFDAFFGKGIGLGIESVYDPPFRPTQFYTRNYYATDIPLDDPTRRNRYRFQGTYYDRIYDTTVDGMYDFVSDAEMASDYTTRDFDLKTAGRTQLAFRYKQCAWLANLFTRVRVNNFQSVNQELPSLQLNWHPTEIPSTGIIFENTIKASYLDYVFSEDVPDASSFSSGRFATHPFFYRPFFFGPLTATPEAGFIGIAYSNSPESGSVGQALGEFGVKLESALTKCSAGWKHVVEPYIHYSYLTSPSVSPERHFIFTINDGWDRLNLLRFGVRNSFFIKAPCNVVRPIWIDTWANAFFDTHTIPQTIPRGYLNIEWMPYERIFVGMDGAWHFQEKQIDFYNARIEWSMSENVAFGVEYRYRSRFDWRKADFYSFILESVRSQAELLASPLSDRRDAFLFRTFYRLNPDWAAKFDLRHGWHRVSQSPYLEYQIEMARLIFQHWKLTFKYERRETDNRYSFSILMDPGPPLKRKACF